MDEKIIFKQEVYSVIGAAMEVYDQIIIELKTLQSLSSREMAQLLNELKAAEMPLGLLINFGNPAKLEWKRFVKTRKSDLFRED